MKGFDYELHDHQAARILASLRNGLMSSSGPPAGVEDFTLYPSPAAANANRWRVVQQEMDAIRRAQEKRARLAREKQERRKR